MNLAAATISYTIPGLHFVHDGQQEGRTRRISMHVNMRVGLRGDVKDPNLKDKYARLISAVSCNTIKNGHWGGCTVSQTHTRQSRDFQKMSVESLRRSLLRRMEILLTKGLLRPSSGLTTMSWYVLLAWPANSKAGRSVPYLTSISCFAQVFSAVNFCGDESNGHIVLPSHL